MIIVDKEDWVIEVTKDGMDLTLKKTSFTAKEARELAEDIHHCLFNYCSITGRSIDEPECR